MSLFKRRRSTPRPTSLRRVLIAHPSPDLYGSDRVMLESASAFMDAGAAVTVTLPGDGPLVPLLRDRGVSVVFGPTPVLRKSALSPRGFIGLARDVVSAAVPSAALVRRVDPDLIYVNTVTIPGWIVLARAMGRRVVCHVHEAEASQSRAVRSVLYAPLLAATSLIANSQYVVDVMASTWRPLARRTAVVYNPVPASRSEQRPLRTMVQKPRLLFIGRLSPRKGPQVAVSATRLLRNRGIPAHLSLLGSVYPGYEWFEQQLHTQVEEQQLEDAVDFLGFQQNVWGSLAEHDIVLVPSIGEESFGNTAVEAILAGRPLVVSDSSGLKEAAQGYANARLVTIDDPDAIARAVADLLESWQQVVATIGADQQEALRRHGPDTYRHALVAQLSRPTTR